MQNSRRAFELFLAAARQNHSVAQFNVGCALLEKERGQAKDKAVDSASASASSTPPTSSLDLKDMKDMKELRAVMEQQPLYWFERAAAAGSADASAALYSCYSEGIGGADVNLARALQCLHDAVDRGHQGAVKVLDQIRRKDKDSGKKQE